MCACKGERKIERKKREKERERDFDGNVVRTLYRKLNRVASVQGIYKVVVREVEWQGGWHFP